MRYCSTASACRPDLLQGHGLSEKGLLVFGEDRQVLVEGNQRLGRAAIVDQRNSQAQLNVRARGIHLGRFAERFHGGLPVLQIALAYAQIEAGGAVRGFVLRQLAVGGRGRLEIAHFVLQVPQRGIQRVIPLARFDPFAEHLDRGLDLALHFKGSRFGDHAGRALAVLDLIDGSDTRREDCLIRFGRA